MPSTYACSRRRPCDSSTVITPSLPTLLITSESIAPMLSSPLERASGAYGLAAAQVDSRIKAITTSGMIDMGAITRLLTGYNGPSGDAALAAIGEQRWVEFAGGEVRYNALPLQLTDETPDHSREFFEYYRTPRGRHPRSTTNITLTSSPAMIQFRPFDHLDTISPRPILFIAGE